jgi:hypothetical protein
MHGARRLTFATPTANRQRHPKAPAAAQRYVYWIFRRSFLHATIAQLLLTVSAFPYFACQERCDAQLVRSAEQEDR